MDGVTCWNCANRNCRGVSLRSGQYAACGSWKHDNTPSVCFPTASAYLRAEYAARRCACARGFYVCIQPGNLSDLVKRVEALEAQRAEDGYMPSVARLAVQLTKAEGEMCRLFGAVDRLEHMVFGEHTAPDFADVRRRMKGKGAKR